MQPEPETVAIRARRALRAEGRHVAPGELARLPLGAALAGLACGQLEIVGPDSQRVRVEPSATWTAPRVAAVAPAPAGWMLTGGDARSVPASLSASGARGYRAARPTRTAVAIFAADGEGWP